MPETDSVKNNRFCSNCGESIMTYDKYCSKCGVEVEIQEQETKKLGTKKLDSKSMIIIGLIAVAVIAVVSISLRQDDGFSSAADAFENQRLSLVNKSKIHDVTLTCVILGKCPQSDLTKLRNDMYQSTLELQRQGDYICAHYTLKDPNWCENTKSNLAVALKMLDENKPTEPELNQVGKISG